MQVHAVTYVAKIDFASDVGSDVVTLDSDTSERLAICTIDYDAVVGVSRDDISCRRSGSTDECSSSVACYINAVTTIGKRSRARGIKADDIASDDVVHAIDVDTYIAIARNNIAHTGSSPDRVSG